MTRLTTHNPLAKVIYSMYFNKREMTKNSLWIFYGKGHPRVLYGGK